MREELKSCPFCGGEANTEGNHVYCSDCGVMPAIMDETKDSLNNHIKLWNTRPQTLEPFDEDKLSGYIRRMNLITINDGEATMRNVTQAICSKFGQPQGHGIEGHDKECYYCHKKTNAFAGNPSEWPIPLCHKDEPGKVKWHHIGCVSERLIENQPQGQVVWPKEKSSGKFQSGKLIETDYEQGWNNAIDACQQAHAEAKTQDNSHEVLVLNKKLQMSKKNEVKICGDHSGKGYEKSSCIICDFEHRNKFQGQPVEEIKELKRQLQSWQDMCKKFVGVSMLADEFENDPHAPDLFGSYVQNLINQIEAYADSKTQEVDEDKLLDLIIKNIKIGGDRSSYLWIKGKQKLASAIAQAIKEGRVWK